MKRVMVDTNVAVDLLMQRPRFVEDARRIFYDKSLKICIATNSVTDVYYIVAKNSNKTTAHAVVSDLLMLCEILPVTGEDCRQALSSPISDYEDAILDECAARNNIKYLITRDKTFANSHTKSDVRLAADF
ncbi:MAG: PIN domain-containing protein [Candidatus Nomurabacteria bacterium]|jgi:predicted nucleic acid-binding protein|nr:PIN domain-containing protein [Candidatus Nomurabacteria bacterium]